MRFFPLVIVSMMMISELFLIPIAKCFQLKWTPSTNHPATIVRSRNGRKIVGSQNRIASSKLRFLDSDDFHTTAATAATASRLKMTDDANNPDFLLRMAEELATEELTPETMAKMERVEIALANFLDETSAAVLERVNQSPRTGQSKPIPPSVPPPGALLETEDNPELQWQQQQRQYRDLATDLANAGRALEILQYRLRKEEEGLFKINRFFPPNYFEERKSTIGEEDILLEAEEALRKSREAAEKRKFDAEQRSLTAARLSAGYLRQQMENKEEEKQQEQQEQEEQQEQKHFQQEESIPEPFGGVNSYGEEFIPSQYQDDGSDDAPRTKNRPTMELGSLFGKSFTGEMGGKSGSGEKINTTSEQEVDCRVPEGIPILCDWVQDEYGCISGNIRGSTNFRDGAKISTSSVFQEARGGTIVTTESGSRYFLQEPETISEDFGDEQYRNTVALQSTEESHEVEAPDGVPTVKSWEVREDGGIIGLIYGSPSANDGDYIETSPVVEGTVDNFSVVSTRSGSRYFLSGDSPEDFDTLDDYEDDRRISNRRRGTITLSKVSPPLQQQPRSTFSLSAMFDDGKEATRNTSPHHLHDRHLRPRPSTSLPPPEGFPTLRGCVFNDDGTITGYVFGSPKINDGFLITTSPIVRGERKQFETVITASGSVYFLG